MRKVSGKELSYSIKLNLAIETKSRGWERKHPSGVKVIDILMRTVNGDFGDDLVGQGDRLKPVSCPILSFNSTIILLSFQRLKDLQ